MSMGATTHAQAQANGEGEALEEIVITGSRIVRRDFEANSPIVTVDEELFDQSASAAIETQLNQLPQFTPTIDVPTSGGDIQPNARNTPGEATVALRGLGANRNLVLINGRRATPSNASMTVDINSIPSVAIERVEVISGGASATYGADAMSGVVNFIMKRDFQGLELDVQSGITQEGDNFEYQVSGIMGADFDDGRGNVSIAFSTNKRNDAQQKDRSWYRDLWADPSIGGTGFFPPFSGFNTGFNPFNQPDPAVVNEVIGSDFATEGPNPLTSTSFYSDFQGNAFSGFGASGVPGVVGAEFVGSTSIPGGDFVNSDDYPAERFILQDNGQLGVNNTDNFLILPLKRYNMYARGNYEINDYVGAFANAYFSKTTTKTVQEPGPLVSGWTVNVNPNINRDVIPDELLTILDSRPSMANNDPDDPATLQDDDFQLVGLLPQNRASETDVFTYNITVGLEGDIPTTDWTWEAFAQQGESQTTVRQTGFASLQRIDAVINSGPNFGAGFDSSADPNYGNAGPPNFGFGAATATCESGLNPFDWSSVTQDCWDAINADIQTKGTMQQTIWQANLQGGVFELPAGQVRAAFGASYRQNDYEFLNDTLVTQGESFIEQSLGLYPAGDSEGTLKVQELYGELLIPILSDMPGVEEFNLELGGRMSDYNTTGTSWTYKILGDWSVTDWLRFRGGYNRAERAPNVAELFLAAEQTFAVAGGGDVCSTANGQSWSANPDANDNWRDVLALCGQLMEASGNLSADDNFYGADYRTLTAATSAAELRNLVTEGQPAGPSFLFPTTVGNPNLDTEKADTWTLGTVIQSPFDSRGLRDMTLSIDYYRIKVTDAIGEQSADIVMRQCVSSAFNSELDPSSPFCDGFKRNQTGAIGNLQRTFFNNGRFKTSGLDIQLQWGMEAGPGRVNLNSTFNYLIDKKSAELDVLPMQEFAGTFGPNQNGLNGNSYRWQSLTTLSYSISGLNVGIEWQHLPSINSTAAVEDPDTTIQGAPSYNKFDLQGSYQLTADLGLRFGVENIFNKRPPLTGRNSAPLPGSLPGGSFDGANYDTNGRRFYMGARANF